MTQPHHLWPDVEVDGSALSGAVASLLEQVVVDHHQHLPDMFAITFHDPARDVISQLHVNIGSTVSIKMTPPGGSPKTLIKGEVTGFEAEYDATRLRTILRGYDLSHRLHRGRETQTYKNVTDSDVARQVAQRASLQVGQIDSTSVTFDHVSQANQSGWDFLKARAREIGFEMGMDEGKFYFRQPVQASGAPQAGDYQNHTDPLQLVFGDDLLEFRPRVPVRSRPGFRTVPARWPAHSAGRPSPRSTVLCRNSQWSTASRRRSSRLFRDPLRRLMAWPWAIPTSRRGVPSASESSAIVSRGSTRSAGRVTCSVKTATEPIS